MTRAARRGVGALVVGLLTASAQASDFSGIASIYFGIPGLVVANAVAVGFLLASASRTRAVVALAVLVPVAFLGVLMTGDAATLYRFADDGRLLPDLYFGLLAVLVVQIALLVRRLVVTPSAG